MKSILHVALLSLFSATVATAQVSLGWGVHGNAAQVSVGGSLSNVYGWGYGGGAHVDVDLLMISLRFSGDYTTIALDQDKYRSELTKLLGPTANSYTIEGGNLKFLTAMANLKWKLLPLPVVSPYLTGGIGIARMSIGDLTVRYQGAPIGGLPTVETQTKSLINIGGGVDLKLAGVALFVEGRYTWILTDSEKTGYIPISVGITF
jgi:opacity protein-like surface antigen